MHEFMPLQRTSQAKPSGHTRSACTHALSPLHSMKHTPLAASHPLQEPWQRAPPEPAEPPVIEVPPVEPPAPVAPFPVPPFESWPPVDELPPVTEIGGIWPSSQFSSPTERECPPQATTKKSIASIRQSVCMETFAQQRSYRFGSNERTFNQLVEESRACVIEAKA
jgi:hypothetical protein